MAKTGSYSLVAFVAIAIVFSLYSVEVGRFLSTDEIAYKAPGREWAHSGSFAAPELAGFWANFVSAADPNPRPPDLDEVWLINSPLYPMLFGAYVNLTGFGRQQSLLFDALIRVLLGLVTYLVTRRIAPALSPWAAAVAGSLVLVLGTEGRPDDLAVLFGMLGILPLLSSPIEPRQAVISGLLFGTCAAAGAVAAFMLGLVALPILVSSSSNASAFFRSALLFGLAALISILAVVVPILAEEPHAYRQFLALARWNAETEANWPIVEQLLFALRNGHDHFLLATLGLTVALVGPPGRSTAAGGRRWAALWVGCLAALAFMLCFYASKHYYYWYVGPWLIAVSTVSLAPRVAASTATTRYVSLIAVIVAVTVIGANRIKQGLVMLTLSPSQSFQHNVDRVRRIIPPGSSVLDHTFWWGLAPDRQVFDKVWSRPSLDEVDYVILDGNGSGEPGTPVAFPPEMQAYVEANFRPVYNNLNKKPLRLLGVRMTRSAYGFGCLVLARARQTFTTLAPAERPTRPVNFN